MSLEEYQVAAVVLRRRVPEMIEAHVVQRRRRGEAGDVAAEFRGLLVGAQHHCRRVPAHVGTDTVFQLVIAGGALLLAGRDGVDVGGIGAVRKVSARAPRLLDQLLEDVVRALGTFMLQDSVEGVQPLVCLLRIVIRKCCHGSTLGEVAVAVFRGTKAFVTRSPFCKNYSTAGRPKAAPGRGVAARHLAAGGMRPSR